MTGAPGMKHDRVYGDDPAGRAPTVALVDVERAGQGRHPWPALHLPDGFCHWRDSRPGGQFIAGVREAWGYMNSSSRAQAPPMMDLGDVFATARVLIVEDSWSDAVLVERMLRSAGVSHIHTTADAAEAGRRAREHDVDLVLLDLHMPGMDGFQALAQLRSASAEAVPVPVLVLTADCSRDTRNRALKCGASDFVTKPLDRVEVVLRARNLLQTRSLHRRLDRRSEQYRRRLHAVLEVAAQITGGSVDMPALAQRIVAGVTAVTEFEIAVLSLRDGDGYRRVAASGTDDPRLGLRTEAGQWQALLREEYRRGELTYLVPPGAPASQGWIQTAAAPEPRPALTGEADRWTSQHGLVLELLDHAGQRAGFLSVDAPSTGQLPDDDTVRLLELFARQALAGLDNVRLIEELRGQRDDARALREVADVLASSLDADELLQRCCHAVIGRSVGDRASVYLQDADAATFRVVASSGLNDRHALTEAPAATSADTPVFARAVHTGRPVVVERVTTDHVRQQDLDGPSVESLAVYPLRVGRRTVGMLVVDAQRAPVRFPDGEVQFVEQIAAQTAVALENAQLHRRVARHADRVASLHELTKQMTRTLDLDTIYDRVVEEVESRGPDLTVSILESAHGRMRRLRTARPTAVGPTLMGDIPLHDLPQRLLDELSERGHVVVADVHGTELERLSHPGTRSVLAGMHREEDGQELVLAVSSHRPDAFHADDAAFVKGLVETVALARRNAVLHAEVRQAAERDALTGLKNRRMYRTEVSALLANAAPDRPVALAMLDVDDFKAINDRHGHEIGDRVLIHVADRLHRSLRENDEVYRLGGEEFAVAMPGARPTDAVVVAERIRHNVATARTDLPAVPTLSTGIAVAPHDGGDLDTLFRAADRALYRAKSAGKNTVRTSAR